MPIINNEDYVLNPRTQRMILKTSRQCVLLQKQGLITLEAPPEPEPEPIKAERKKPSSAAYKKALMHSMTDVARDNKTSFKNLSQKESDKMLKKLLYEKLMVPKKKPKKKKPVVVSSSESDSGSDQSESDSDSSIGS